MSVSGRTCRWLRRCPELVVGAVKRRVGCAAECRGAETRSCLWRGAAVVDRAVRARVRRRARRAASPAHGGVVGTVRVLHTGSRFSFVQGAAPGGVRTRCCRTCPEREAELPRCPQSLRHDDVGFSEIDLASHERGYPALRKITGQVVGGLVFTPQAAAGDLWLPDGSRDRLVEVIIPGGNLIRLTPAAAHVAASDSRHDRQARLFGDRGQQAFGLMRVAVVGLGGVGSLVVVATVVISTLTPVLVGLVALGFVLPFLVRLKLPGGVEADLSASLNQVSSGPTGEVSIGPGRLVGRSSDVAGGSSPLGSGPRGELPRLG
jgi:hypothetical protein